KTRTELVGEEHGADRRDDEVAEHQEHPGDRDGARDHKAERHVEEKIPEVRIDARRFRLLGVQGDRHEFLAEGEMEEADDEVHDRRLEDEPRLYSEMLSIVYIQVII